VPQHLSRRDWLTRTPLALGAGLAAASSRTIATSTPPAQDAAAPAFGLCLNTSTIRGQKLGLAETVDLVAEVGYDGIEPWVREIDEFVAAGGSLRDLAARIRDHGLAVPSTIGFFDWIVDDPARRAKGLDEGKRSMDLVRQIGATRIAAPPTGATDTAMTDFHAIADRFATVVELGKQHGVTPQLEVWGFSKTITRLADAAHVVIDSGHPDACLLADVYHLYKGGSPENGLRFLNSSALQHFHVNDYPDIPRDAIKDADRVYPGDGVAPIAAVLRDLQAVGYQGMLSLELFNPTYWEQDARLVARNGLEKMRAVVQAALPVPRA
jgi:sugar phosphate isomerase/epimerase